MRPKAARWILAAILLAACGALRSTDSTPTATDTTSGRADQTTPTSTISTQAQPVVATGTPILPAASPTPTLEPADIVFQRHSGPNGESREWRIYRDGHIQSSDGHSGQVAPGQVEALLYFIQSSGFFSMAARYQADTPCCARFTYQLLVRDAQGTEHEVIAIEGANEAPSALWEIFKLVEQLVDRALLD